jgi:hypothetical protein
LVAILVGPALAQSPAGTAGRPNFLLILSDDQRHDTMDYMPRTKAHIFGEGVSFPNAYITTPLCCPSRSSILTGMYAHKHGVRLNPIPLQKETFVQQLKGRLLHWASGKISELGMARRGRSSMSGLPVPAGPPATSIPG